MMHTLNDKRVLERLWEDGSVRGWDSEPPRLGVRSVMTGASPSDPTAT